MNHIHGALGIPFMGPDPSTMLHCPIFGQVGGRSKALHDANCLKCHQKLALSASERSTPLHPK